MNNLIAKIAIITILSISDFHAATAQNAAAGKKSVESAAAIANDGNHSANGIMATKTDSAASTDEEPDLSETGIYDEETGEEPLLIPEESEGLHKSLKKKYIEGNAIFMSLVALVLVLGLAFCIERIIYLTLSEIDAKRLLADIGRMIDEGNIDEAKNTCRNTRGPVASICYEGLARIDEDIEDIERGIASYGSVQAANLENGCSWITMFITMAPSLGFLGTVIGIVMTFEEIQGAGDISPTIVAAGMKVALITTIFGLISALTLQIFYNYILSKIEHITSQMEESAITILDSIMKYKQSR